jgi:hypothetical protein
MEFVEISEEISASIVGVETYIRDAAIKMQRLKYVCEFVQDFKAGR